MVFEKLKKILAGHVDCDPESITAETTFESLGIDSLDTVEMLMGLEEELGVELKMEEKSENVGQLAAFIEKQIGAK